ncbi:methyltransferase domain-containing protein [Bradyrhizobium sp. ORS 86]|uniref:methyltransferase domain-containing protein n=1 Tax=Bradyrhizobium sp. ORS 86 TaxID=1685970 RepID=UPI00388F78B4
MIKAKSIVKGAASNFIPRFRHSGTGTDGAFSAEGAYAIFMRYLLALSRAGTSFADKTVVEFGPGSSFGVGIAALLAGARRYYAFDLIDHTDDERNLVIFDVILRMFQTRAPVPIGGWCARIFPLIDDPAFPADLLPDALLAKTLDPDRVSLIRRDLASKGGLYIRPRSSANIASAKLDEPADVIISESVLEHVDDLKPTYETFARWLTPDGVMAHLIDYGSHNLSDDWNGHWTCSPKTWSLVRGKRAYLINRVPHHGHLKLLADTGMEVVHSQLLRRVDGALIEEFSPEFRSMDPRDATTALASVVCRRASPASASRTQ